MPYHRLYPWTVRECPLGCGFTGKAAGCQSVLFCTAVIYALSKGNSIMRVGLMPRAEKRVIECFVSTTDAQILQSILDLVHTAGKTECSELSVRMRTLLDSCTEQFTVVYGHISRMHRQCIPGPLPSFGRGLGTRLGL